MNQGKNWEPGNFFFFTAKCPSNLGQGACSQLGVGRGGLQLWDVGPEEGVTHPHGLTAGSGWSEEPESKDWPSNLTSGVSVRCVSVRVNVHDTIDVYVSFPWDLVMHK